MHRTAGNRRIGVALAAAIVLFLQGLFGAYANAAFVATAPLEPEILNALRSSTETHISFTGAQQGDKPQSLPVSFNGFRGAYGAYSSGNSRRDSWFWRLF